VREGGNHRRRRPKKNPNAPHNKRIREVADHSLPDAAGLTFGGIDVGRTLQMPDISIQFHAIPDEMRDFAEEIVHDFSLHMVAMKFFPFEAVEVKPNDIARVFSDESPGRGYGQYEDSR
jgi:hypothetical protein